MKVWWNLPRGVTWRELWTSLMTTISTEGGSRFTKRRGVNGPGPGPDLDQDHDPGPAQGQDPGPGQDQGGPDQDPKGPEAGAEVVVERRKILNLNHPDQGREVEVRRKKGREAEVRRKKRSPGLGAEARGPEASPAQNLAVMNPNPDLGLDLPVTPKKA